jgi:tol-pal system protein YbgF
MLNPRPQASPALTAALIVTLNLLAVSAWAREPAPVVEATGTLSATKSLESRVTRIERLLENQTLVEMMTRVDGLQQEVNQLLGQLEEQTHEMEGLKKRQRDLYLDMDRRLRAMEEAQAAAKAVPPATMGTFVPAPTPAAPAGETDMGNATGMGSPPAAASSATMESPAAMVPSSPLPGPGALSAAPAITSTESSAADAEKERQAYERAFELLKQGRYDLAVAAFKAFVQSYPSGQYADNAQYWLGEANYVQRQFKDALKEFQAVVNNHPTSPKRPDAMLKMGYTYQELGDLDQARMTLNNVITNYPASTAARLAQKRLQNLKAQP